MIPLSPESVPLSRDAVRKCGSLIASVCLALACSFPSPAYSRTWTDGSGKFTVEAEFDSYNAGQVTLKKLDGTTTTLPFEKLSKADQDFLKQVVPVLRANERPAKPIAGLVAQQPAANAVPQQANPGPWTVTDDKNKVVALFPETPQYSHHLSSVFGRIKEWKCSTKTGLQVSFQFIQKMGADPGTTLKKMIDPSFRLDLDKDGNQESISPTLLARVLIPDLGAFVLKIASKGRNLSPDEVALFRNWSNDLRVSLKWLDAKNASELINRNMQPWFASDGTGQIIATFPVPPDYRYSVEPVTINDQPNAPNEYVRMREWKCSTKEGTLIVYRMYLARGGEGYDRSQQAALRLAHIDSKESVRLLNTPDGLETISPGFLARMTIGYEMCSVLSLKSKGKELSSSDLDLYNIWTTRLPIGAIDHLNPVPKFTLVNFEACLLAKTAPKNKPLGWPIKIDGHVVGEFPNKPTHHFALTKRQGKVHEWTSIAGQTRVSFYTVTVTDTEAGAGLGSHDLAGWLTDKFGIEHPQFPPLFLLRPNLLVDLEWVGSSSDTKTATIFTVATPGGNLTQRELELYDQWNGGHAKENFEKAADYLGKNVK